MITSSTGKLPSSYEKMVPFADLVEKYVTVSFLRLVKPKLFSLAIKSFSELPKRVAGIVAVLISPWDSVIVIEPPLEILSPLLIDCLMTPPSLMALEDS